MSYYQEYKTNLVRKTAEYFQEYKANLVLKTAEYFQEYKASLVRKTAKDFQEYKANLVLKTVPFLRSTTRTWYEKRCRFSFVSGEPGTKNGVVI
ncbi:MAG TPA: hypothetical protein ENG03_10290 [Thioploca sp.]|nr:hypothetical protein [Thioploca sp.]